MLKKRIIPMLLLKDGRMVKGKKFTDFRDTGDAVSASKIYNAQNADELIFIDIQKSKNGRGALIGVIEKVSEVCFMPLTVGGGIRTNQDVRTMLRAGADKVVITTAALENPAFIKEASLEFGCQCIVVGLDVKKVNGDYVLYSNCNTKKWDKDIVSFVREMDELGTGEFFVNSIDNDGMMEGYDLDLIKLVAGATSQPLICAGGAGNFSHLVDVFKVTSAMAVACASIFHFGDNNPIRARSFLLNNGIPMKVIK